MKLGRTPGAGEGPQDERGHGPLGLGEEARDRRTPGTGKTGAPELGEGPWAGRGPWTPGWGGSWVSHGGRKALS